MTEPYEMYLLDSPWIIISYLTSDAEADASGGRSRVRLECCICGQREVKDFILPAEDDPIWDVIDPREGTPEAKVIKQEFQLTHVHEDRQGKSAMLTWARPLKNPAALKGGIDVRELKQRLMLEIEAGKRNPS